MNFQEFCDTVFQAVSESCPEESTPILRTFLKNNDIERTALLVQRSDTVCSPILYLDFYYERLAEGISLDSLIAEILHFFNTDHYIPSVKRFIEELTDPRPYLRIRMIQAASNRRLLQMVPYQTCLDLAAVCELSVPAGDRSGTALLHKGHLSGLGLTEEELFSCAWKNTVSGRIPILKPIDHPLLFLEEAELTPEFFDRLPQICADWRSRMFNPVSPLFVLTNRQNLHGAACIFYPDVLRTISNALHADLYLIPSSIHEMLITPVPEADISGTLTEILQEVNIEAVPSTEILGSHIYYYDRLSGRLHSLPDPSSASMEL